MIKSIVHLALTILCAWVGLSVGCELRNYSGSHRTIRAFRAESRFQKLFTVLQRRNDIHRNDLGKLTYIGYVGVVIGAVLAVFAIPVAVFFIVAEIYVWSHVVIGLWGAFCVGWGIVAMLIQGVDSLINRYF